MVDRSDKYLLEKHGWSIGKRGYVVASIGGKVVSLHRLIMGYPSIEVDHINQNKLDNRRANLRLATRSQNEANKPLRKDNTSGYRGVTWDAQHSKWRVQIQWDKKMYRLGRYVDIDEAVRVRDKVAKKLHGEFAWLNQI
jgi:hypothetical protein